MAFDCHQSEGDHREIAREFAMPPSSASAVMFLPFGSLTGVIPIDVVPQERVVGEFSGVLASSAPCMVEIQQQTHSVIAPVPASATWPPTVAMSERGDSGV